MVYFYLSTTVGCFYGNRHLKEYFYLDLKLNKKVNVGSSWGESSRLSKMAAEPTREWSDEQLKSDDLPKKDVIKFIQDNAAHSVCLPIWCLCSVTFK